jgi:hypothetical protein
MLLGLVPFIIGFGYPLRCFAFLNRVAIETTRRAGFFGETELLYMIVEHFKNRDPVPIYRRFRDQGRMAPQGLEYVSSWVDEKLHLCFQLMETDHPEYIDEWLAHWKDLVEFEVYPVIPSKEAVERVAPLL